MTIIAHDELPIHVVPRIRTRVLAGAMHGARSTAIWEQWIEPDGYIPLHFHDVEEVLMFLSGDVLLTVNEETTLVRAPASVTVAPGVIHGLRPAGESLRLYAVFPVADPAIRATDGSLRPLPWDDVDGGEIPPG